MSVKHAHTAPDPGAKRWSPSPLLVASAGLHIVLLIWLLLRFDHWPYLLATLVVNHMALAFAGLWPRSQWLGPNRVRLPDAAISKKMIAITIDDGPDPEVTPQVLAILRETGVHASFFCIGERAAQHPELCRQIIADGHRIENHTQSHRHDFSITAYRGLFAEIGAGQQTLTQIGGQAPRFFRAPAGLRNPFLDPVLHRLGLQLCAWTRRGFDTRCRDPHTVLARLTDQLAAGDILLLHDGHAARQRDGTPLIIAVLPELLAACRARGLHPVRLDEAIAPL